MMVLRQWFVEIGIRFSDFTLRDLTTLIIAFLNDSISVRALWVVVSI